MTATNHVGGGAKRPLMAQPLPMSGRFEDEALRPVLAASCLIVNGSTRCCRRPPAVFR
jgi:hypothetical protein